MEIKDYLIEDVKAEEYTKVYNPQNLLYKNLKKFDLDGSSFSFKYYQKGKLVGIFVKRDFLILTSKNLRNNLEAKFVEDMLILFKKKLN